VPAARVPAALRRAGAPARRRAQRVHTPRAARRSPSGAHPRPGQLLLRGRASPFHHPLLPLTRCAAAFHAAAAFAQIFNDFLGVDVSYLPYPDTSSMCARAQRTPPQRAYLPAADEAAHTHEAATAAPQLRRGRALARPCVRV
jgi:hypothetical protein